MRKLLALLFLAICGCATGPIARVGDRDLSLGGVALGDTEQAVVARLGPPSHKVDTGEGTEFQYLGLSVLIGWLEQEAPGTFRRVLELNATGSETCTPAGICPGMTITAAKAHYGSPLLVAREGVTFLEYYSSESSCWLQLLAPTGTINSISAVCQP